MFALYLFEGRGKAFQLTDDHKPNDPEESKRIKAVGGNVTNMAGIWRVTQHVRIKERLSFNQTYIFVAIIRLSVWKLVLYYISPCRPLPKNAQSFFQYYYFVSCDDLPTAYPRASWVSQSAAVSEIFFGRSPRRLFLPIRR